LPETQLYYVATMAAVDHALAQADLTAEVMVVRTDTIDSDFVEQPGDGVLVGPGSPYERPDLAEDVIRSARERGIPLVGT